MVYKAAKPKKKAAAKPLTALQKYLASDVNYQSGLNELTRNMQQFRISNQGSQADVKESFQTAMQRMGKERGKALDSLGDDFASRNLLTSGLYTGAVNDYNSEYADRTTDLTKDQQNQLESLTTQLSNMQGLTGTKTQELKLDAM